MTVQVHHISESLESFPSFSKPTTPKSLDSLGADIEYIVRDKRTKKPVSMVNILPPQEDAIKLSHGTLFHDGVMAEINIKPEKSPYRFAENIFSVIRETQNYLNNLGFLLDRFNPIAKYPDRELETEEAWTVGCKPFFDVYKNREVLPPEYTDSVRMAGGHLHIGYSDKDKICIPDLIQSTVMCDAVLYLPFRYAQYVPSRYKSYGRPGSIRFKPYGLEYRPLTNSWTSSFPIALKTLNLFYAAFSKDHVRWVIQQGILNKTQYTKLQNRYNRIMSNIGYHEIRTFPALKQYLQYLGMLNYSENLKRDLKTKRTILRQEVKG